jgi:hypothetical protein
MIFYIALMVIAVAAIVWLLCLFMDGRRLRRERREWRQDLARQREMFGERP